MRRKVLAGTLALLMAFGICGCASQTGETTPAAEETTGTKSAEQEVTEETPEAEEATDEAAPMQALIYTKNYYEYDEELERVMFTGVQEGVVLAEECKETYPKLYDALQKEWESRLSEGDATRDEQVKESRSMYEDVIANGGTPEEYMTHFTQEDKIHLHRADEKVFSYSTNFYSYWGGAHGMYGDWGDTFDTATGKKLALSDVITDLDAYGQLLFDKVAENYPDVVEYLDDPTTLRDQIVSEVKDPEISNWELDPDGIVYFFNPYDIAAYASGQQIVKVGYNESPELFNEAYLPPEGRDYINFAPGGNRFLLDTDGDGDFETVSVYEHYEEGSAYDEYYGFDVSIGEQKPITIANDVNLYSYSGWCAEFANGKTYLMVDCQTDNDYHVLVVCEVGNANVREVGRYGNTPRFLSYDEQTEISCAYTYTDPACLQMVEHFDRLSTYSAGGTYRMTDQGVIEALSEYAYLSEDNRRYFVLTSKAEIRADVVDEVGEVKEADAVFAAGTKFTIYRTSYPSDAYENCLVDCLLEDGTIVRFRYTMDGDGNRLINGHNEWDIFDNLLYAG